MSKENSKQKQKSSDLIECELKESKSLEEFKAKFSDVKTILELSRQADSEVATAEKIDWAEYDRIITRETARRATEIMNQIEALNDFWHSMISRFVTVEGSEEIGRHLAESEKQALYKLLTKGICKMSAQQLYEVTRHHVSLSDEPYTALAGAAEKAGVTTEKLLNDVLCEHFKVEA
jgi:hypothetical protein